MGIRTFGETQHNHVVFVRECHAVFKRALGILIKETLALEKLIGELDKKDKDYKKRKARYEYWLRLIAFNYDTFIWITSNLDRSEVLKRYKGRKHGALANQNIQSVTDLANQMNNDPDVLAIPLDFSRFSCISDLLRIRHSADGRVSADFIEVKEGEVNNEIFEAIKAKDPEKYLNFFRKYGDKGMQQVERIFKQEQTADGQIKLFGLQPGVYDEKDRVRIVTEFNPGEAGSFHDLIEPLVHRARAGTYSVETVGDCLVLATLDATSEERYVRTDFVARCVVHAAFGDRTETGEQEKLFRALQVIEFEDWRSGFGSPLCVPPTLRPLSARSFLDLMFGRIRLLLHMDGASFVRICRDRGVRVGFLTTRCTNRLRTGLRWQKGEVPLWNGKAIGFIAGGESLVFTRSYYDEIVFNWRMPEAIAEHMAQFDSEVAGSPVLRTNERGVRQLFSEDDMEAAD